MSDFKAKMHKIRFPLGLRPRPRSGSFSAVFKGMEGKRKGNRRGGARPPDISA